MSASHVDAADLPEVIPVAGQPLAANAARVLSALDLLGTPLPRETAIALQSVIEARDAEKIQTQLDPHVLFLVQVNPESRVKVLRGPARASLQQAGYTPVLVKVVNQSTVTKELHISSPQAGQVYAGMTPLSAQRLQRQLLKETETKTAAAGRFLDVEMFSSPPMTASLSGLEVEYALALIYSRDAGQREATIGFDVGMGTQDPGFRGEAPVLFEVRPAVPVKLRIRDHQGEPATARLVFHDAADHVYPPQAKRIAPDFYFQEQIYRRDGDVVLLPPGKLTLESSRGPEYRVLHRDVEISSASSASLEIQLVRWIDPAASGFYSGDHHIHGAGCAHYTSPTEGVTPQDMFRQVDGEGLNVGCVLTWGPCFDYQRRFFSPGIDQISRPNTLLKYDLEISGFGSESLGHVCLLNLKDQNYPGADGTKVKGWPKWTTPVMRWAKAQGGYAGYAHSGSGLEIHSQNATRRLFAELDTNKDALLTPTEAMRGLLPEKFENIDSDHDGALTEAELIVAHDRVAGQLPNLAVPEMNGVGAMEICVSTAAGVCDFISAMDTPRIAEWNMWYHILNCGFPLKVSGETDFPCMSGDRIGQGRVYVQLGKVKQLDFAAWCDGLARGRSYVSDGFAHALEFTVNKVAPGFGEVSLATGGLVYIRAKVAFAAEQPLNVAHGGKTPPDGKRWVGDTVTMHAPPSREIVRGGQRLVEIVVNGKAVAAREVAADGQVHDLSFDVNIDRSSWIALRHFPQLHTNPVNVLVAGTPVRASRASALWCVETIRQLWRARGQQIPESERAAAQTAFDEAVAKFQRIAVEAPEGT
ncbi:MAG: CehA/McbA family metallohydrolase [Verrucomicrobia bacterium]|nr:CehA/McbA family metallohydrolase [Verrucomicrobiota bacterium]